MATKMYRVRLTEMSPRLEAALGRTHRVFVECLRQMVQRYLQMRKGRYGDDCRRLALEMLSRSNTFAHGVMDKLSRPRWEADITEDWVGIARRILGDRGPLFEQHKGFATVGGVVIHTKPNGRVEPTSGKLAVTAKFWHQVCDSASAYVKSFDELMATWRQEREQWLQEKNKWENDHPEFMAFWRGPYAEFETTVESARINAQLAAGRKPTERRRDSRQRGKRIARWHLWYEWVVSHPEIVEWRGQATAADFRKVPADVEQLIKHKHPRQDKHVPKFLAWLDDNNPELASLNSLRRSYVRRFLRFRRPPTFTLPSPEKHPYWFTFERNEFYQDVDFEAGTIQLRLIDEEPNGEWVLRYMPARFRCDPSLIPSKRREMFLSEGRYPPYIEGKPGRKLNRPAEKAETRRAGYAGAKLVIRKKRKELLFTIVEQDSPRRVKWMKVTGRQCPADNCFLSDGSQEALTVMAIDLGIRHIGAYAVVEGRRVGATWVTEAMAKGFIKDPSIPNLGVIRQHDRALRAGRRRRGKPIAKDDRSFIELQDHRTSMANDRFKKATGLIVKLARRHNVHVVLFEELSDLSPTAFDERWMNRQLRDMNRRKIVEATKQGCTEFGIECKDDIGPWYTSHVCSRCLRPGWRFSIQRKQPYKEELSRQYCQQFGDPIWDQGGHLFRCPHCGYSVNADVNAAANLAGKFFGRWPKIKRSEWVYHWTVDGKEGSFNAKESFAEWSQNVAQRRRLGETPF